MKIAYCINNIHNSGGIERVLCNKANFLINQGFEVHIVVIYPTDKLPFFTFDPKIRFHYLNLDFEKERGIKKKIRFQRNKKEFLDKISRLFREIKPDIAISTFCKYSKYIYEINDGSKKIIERHFAKYKRAQYYAKLDKYCWGRLITHLYRKKDYHVIKHFDRFIVLTNEDKKSWGNHLPNIEVIENPLTFIPKEHAKLDNDTKKVIALGRLNQQKQFEHLIEIWSSVSRKHPDWKLSIFGNGEKERKLKRMISDMNLDKYVELNPATPDVEKVLTESSIYVMTSKYEGFPLVLLEAMSCGLPAISYSCKCGPKEIIRNGEDGYLVPFNDKKEFIRKLDRLIENENLRKQMGQAASKNILRYSEEKIMQKWITLFDTLTTK
jgi:glycosyltransferase involved in cell wall biosynthesis